MVDKTLASRRAATLLETRVRDRDKAEEAPLAGKTADTLTVVTEEKVRGVTHLKTLLQQFKRVV